VIRFFQHPYRPDFNPIEMPFAKLKAHVKGCRPNR